MNKTLKRIILPVLSESTIGIQNIMRVHNEEGNPMTRKQLSECISGVIESKMVKVASNIGITIDIGKKDIAIILANCDIVEIIENFIDSYVKL